MEHNIIEALETIRERNGGVLYPKAVVEHARNEESPLHSHFTWDDSKAAERWRLEEAHRLIMRIKVRKPAGADKERKVRLYVSLSTDRAGTGGYRQIDEVMADAERRADLMATALGELQALQRKYEDLEGLAPVFKAIEKAAERYTDEPRPSV